MLVNTSLGQAGGPGFEFMFYIAAIILIFYFFFMRPQAKKAKEAQKFKEQLKKGDKIITAGGIYGKILKVDEDSFLVEVDTNTKLRVDKNSISTDAAVKPADSKEKEKA